MIKILYIEDDSAHIELTRRSLENSGAEFNLQTASTITDAFSLLKDNVYDVILSDYRLPDGSGLDVIRIAHEQQLSTAIVLITNQEDINTAVAALKAGAVDYIVKQSDYLHKLPIVLSNAYKHTQIEKQKKELNEIENKYRNIFENAVEGIFQSSPDGRFLSVNPAMAQIYGYKSPEEMIEKISSISTQIHLSADSRNRFTEKLTENGVVENFEARNLKKDGGLIWTSTNARVVKDKNGKILYYEGSITDITKQKNAENAILEAEERYRMLVEKLPAVIFMDKFNDTQSTQYISPRIKELLGYTPQEWEAGDYLWKNSLHPDDRDRVIAEDIRTNETGEPFRIEYRLRHRDGHYVWIKEDASIIIGEDGTPLFWHGILLNITQQKHAEESIKANEGSYRGLFNSVTQAIYIQDKEGRFLDVNDGAITMYGYPRDFFIGKTPEVLSAPNKNDLNSLVKMTERAFAGEPQEFEFWGLRSNGQVFPKTVSLNKGTYFGQDVIIAIAQDITARKQAEKLLERQLKALTVLHAASMAGTQSNTEDEIIEQVTRITAGIYSDMCGVLLLNDQGNVLTPHPSYMGANIINWENGYSIANGITGRAVRTGSSIRINDITNDPDYIEIASETKSELCVPFWVHERIIGVFNVESKQANAFDEEDERLLNTIASGLGTAIEKLRLFEAEQAQRQREAAMLDLIRVAASSLDLNQVLQSILDQLIKVIPSDCGSVQILDGDHLNILAAIGNEAIGFAKRGPLLLSEFPLNNYVVTKKKTVRIDNTLLYDGYQLLNELAKLRSFLGIPLIVKDKTIGMITLDSYQISHFTEQDAELGLALANQAAIAIENARLFQEESRRSKIIEALANIANEIAVTREVIPALDKIAQRTLTLLNALSVAIYLLQDDNQTIKVITAQGQYHKELLSHTIKIGEGITGNIVATGKPEIVDSISTDARQKTVPGTPKEDANFETMMSAPLILHGTPIGAINVWRLKSNGLFDQSELNFLVSIAHQASISIESMRLFEETTRRAQEAAAIAEVGRGISATLQLDNVLERIALYAKDLLRAETSAVYLTEPGAPLLRAISAIGVDSDEIKNDPLQLGIGILGDIAMRKFGEIVNDTTADSRAIPVKGTEMLPHEHIMGVPVLSNDQLTGLLVVWRIGADEEFRATDLDFLSSLAQQAAIAIENARLFEAEHKRRKEAEIVRQAAAALSSLLDLPSLHDAILEWLRKIIPYDSASILEIEADHIRITAAKGLPFPEKALNQIFPSDNILCKTINETGEPLIIEDCEKDPRFERWGAVENIRGWMGVPMITRGQVIGYITIDSHTPNAFTKNDAVAVQTFAHQAANSLENTRLYTETLQRLEELEMVSRVSYALRAARDTKEMIPILLNEIKANMDTDTAAIWLYDLAKNELIPTAASGWLKDIPKSTFKPNEGIVGTVYANGTMHISPELTHDPMIDSGNANFVDEDWGGITIPIRTVSETIGVLVVAIPTPQKIGPNHIRVITTLTEIAGNAIYRSNLFERSEEQIRRLTTLREMDTAITSSLDLHITLGILTEHLLTKMDVSAATVLIFNPDSQTLAYYAPTGFKNRENVRTPRNIGDGLAGQILLNRRAIHISDLNKEPNLLQSKPLKSEQFISYYAVPLFSKGVTRGILETYFRQPFAPSADWLDFLHTLAGQAVIAIDNAQLFENLQRSNQELSLAYDTTLEGWGKALELRDKETQGHTRRVTDLTLELARQMDIPEAELLHIRRGALLHDIGKMGVSDNILHKNGPLTKNQLFEIRKHPKYAYDLLYPIAYLRPALDIAYCHHEWWDGNGYPRGLKGEEIPLSARIFAIIDVWDALLSDRPYRKAWTHKKTLKYIRNLSGKQFDPQVVDAFCKMTKSDSEYMSPVPPKKTRKVTPKKQGMRRKEKVEETKNKKKR